MNLHSSTSHQPWTPAAADTLKVPVTPQIAEELLDYINGDLVDDSGSVHQETELLISGIVDSLGVLQIVAFLETEFDITIDPGDVLLENFQTVAAISAFAGSRAG